MSRFLAALICFGAALLGAPSRSEAGVIPWMYDAIFGYGHAGYGGGYSGGGYGGGYMTGYAPAYPPRYVARMYRASYAFGGGDSYGYGATTNYAPWYGYSAGGACCSPCGTSACSPCGTGACGGGACGTGCENGCGTGCSGGNCGGSGSTNVPSTQPNVNERTGPTPTWASPANEKNAPADDFRSSSGAPRPAAGAGSPGTTPFNSYNPNAPNVEPNNSAPNFKPAPGEPGTPRREKTNEDNGAVTPRLSPINPGDKVAFKTPARFTRSGILPTFQLPTIVSAPPRTVPEPLVTPAVVASK